MNNLQKLLTAFVYVLITIFTIWQLFIMPLIIAHLFMREAGINIFLGQILLIVLIMIRNKIKSEENDNDV